MVNSYWCLKLPQLRPLGSWSGQTCTTLPSLHNALAAVTLLSLGDTGHHRGKSTFHWGPGESGPNALTFECVQLLSRV